MPDNDQAPRSASDAAFNSAAAHGVQKGSLGASKPDADHAPTGPHFHPRSGRRVAIFVVLLVLAMAAVYFVGRRSRMEADSTLEEGTVRGTERAPLVDVARVTRSEPTKTIVLPGEARPFYETVLYARTNGYLRELLVDIGDRVKQGQVLATIETPELDDQVKESEAKLEALRAEVSLAQAAADFARTSFDRWNTSDGVVSQQERDQKKSELESDLAKLAVSKARVNLGEAELQGLRTLQGFKQVAAPFEGIITERHVDIGHLVAAGSASSTTPLFRIAQYDRLRVMVDVPQSVSGDIAVGMRAAAFAPEHAEIKRVGTVDRTSGAIDSHGRTLRVEVLVPNDDHAVLPGTYVQVELTIPRSNPPLQIPAAALTMRSSGPHAAVVSPDGVLTYRKLQIQEDLGERIEVGSGLSEGDFVALNIGMELGDGDHVRVRPPEKPAAAKGVAAAPADSVQHAIDKQ